jgi:hypothetical protein
MLHLGIFENARLNFVDHKRIGDTAFLWSDHTIFPKSEKGKFGERSFIDWPRQTLFSLSTFTWFRDAPLCALSSGCASVYATKRPLRLEV